MTLRPTFCYTNQWLYNAIIVPGMKTPACHKRHAEDLGAVGG